MLRARLAAGSIGARPGWVWEGLRDSAEWTQTPPARETGPEGHGWARRGPLGFCLSRLKPMVTRAPPPTPRAAQRQLRGPPGPALRTTGSASLPSCPMTVAWDGPYSDDIATACRGPTVCRTWSRARKGGEEPEGPALHSPRQPCGGAQAARHPCLGSPSAGREVWSWVCPLSVLLLVTLQTGKPSLRKAPRPATRHGPRRSACVRRHAVGTRQASGHCRAEENVWGRAANCSTCHGPVRVLLKRDEPGGRHVWAPGTGPLDAESQPPGPEGRHLPGQGDTCPLQHPAASLPGHGRLPRARGRGPVGPRRPRGPRAVGGRSVTGTGRRLGVRQAWPAPTLAVLKSS